MRIRTFSEEVDYNQIEIDIKTRRVETLTDRLATLSLSTSNSLLETKSSREITRWNNRKDVRSSNEDIITNR